MTDLGRPWSRAALALDLLLIDPTGLGGIWLRSRAGPVLDRLLAALPDGLRISPNITEEALFGGIDSLATLAAGTLVRSEGLLGKTPRCLILPMAERTHAATAACLVRAWQSGNILISIDESNGPDEALPSVLAERLGLCLDLDGLAIGDCPAFVRPDLSAARDRLAEVRTPPDAIADLVTLAARLGITSLRPPLFALRAARAAAARAGRAEILPEDLALAAALVLGPRALTLPAEPPTEQPPDDPGPEDPAQEDPTPGEAPPRDMLLEAAKTVLPPDLLDRLSQTGAPKSAKGAGAGARRRGNRRGRPLAAQPGRPDQGRVDLMATLRAAAPWQTLRRRASDRFLVITRADIRLRRFEERSDRLLIFAVDASGSAAVARLAEAKGAVELLLAEAYSRRDHVALIAFRGEKAETLLPPTRSLVQAKRRLATLPGGGGTPLASGLRMALLLADSARGHGLTPTLALLTDGRANIALDGAPDRTRAAEDALLLARAIRARQIPALVLDTGNRPRPPLAELAAAMRAPCQPLPRATSRNLADKVNLALRT